MALPILKLTCATYLICLALGNRVMKNKNFNEAIRSNNTNFAGFNHIKFGRAGDGF